MSFDLEQQKLKKELIKRKPKIVLLQLPEGLKSKAHHLTAVIEEAGALPIVSSDSCYGACDLAITEAKTLGADLIVHIGHSPITLKVDPPVIYIGAKARTNIEQAITETLPFLSSWNKIGLVTTIQHIHQLVDAKNQLESYGKTVFIGDTGQLEYSGQVLGCDFSNAQSISENVDAYVFLGGGQFHAIGIALVTGKPTIIADPYERSAYLIHGEVKKLIMQRWASIEEARRAKYFGVLIGLKSGQLRLSKAKRIKEKLEQSGLNVMLLALKEITPNILFRFPRIEAFVNTACPRISLDDATLYNKPILSINETIVMLGEMKWEDLLKKGWFEKDF